MEYVHLGRAGVKVSRLCLGTMNFGPVTSDNESFRIMDRALEHGINFFDTADVYGRHKGKGYTEELIGHWLAQGGRRRERIVLATKVYAQTGEGPNQGRLSALHIRRACERSLIRLQTDYIDLYQMHHIDRETTWEEIWQTLEQLYREGRILYNGSSNFAGWHIARAQEIVRRRPFFGLVSEQSLYNLAERTVELEVIPACQSYGLGLLPWSPLAGGLLCGGSQRAGEGRRSTPEMQARIEANRDRLQAYEQFCRDMGEEPANVALAWLLHNPAVTAPIIGPRTVAQLDSTMRALEIKLSEDALARLDEIFPGPGGPAPEAYAW